MKVNGVEMSVVYVTVISN